MVKRKTATWLARLAFLIPGVGCPMLIGCATSASHAGQETEATTEAKSGVQVWRENCKACHHMRPLSTYNDAQWGVVAHHHLVRAYLTGEEFRAVMQFLRAGN